MWILVYAILTLDPPTFDRVDIRSFKTMGECLNASKDYPGSYCAFEPPKKGIDA